MPDLELAPPSQQANPDWSTINWDVHCPLCEYNLRGLNVPRCPECGYRFAWKEVLDPNRREHPYLFEHHPRRNLWSFRKTVWGAMRPKRFWTSLHPVMPSHPGRMLAYWLATFFCFAVVATVILCQAGIFDVAWNLFEGRGARMGRMPVWGFGGPVRVTVPTNLPLWVWEFLSSVEGACDDADELIWMNLLVLSAWPFLTLLSLRVFRWSMRRAKVNKVHVRRCVLYSFDMIPPALTMLMAFLLLIGQVIAGGNTAWHELFLLFLPLLPVMFGARRLYHAYARYLRFDRPFLTVLASQIMVLLAVMIEWLPWLIDESPRLQLFWLRSLLQGVL